ncbi:TPA: transposase [Neisseria meningitidis]
MKITHCKLKKKVQKELLRFFVLEVTARSAADILGIHPNSAVLFYRKIRNGIENFWNQAKRVLRKYNGIDCKSFPLFLKECEFRFNFGTPSQQLKILRDWCGI